MFYFSHANLASGSTQTCPQRISGSSLKASALFRVESYFKELLANVSASIHVGQSPGLSNRKQPRRDYQRDGGVGGWRFRRRLLWIRREILPVADSGGANSSTKDSQTRSTCFIASSLSRALSSSSASLQLCVLLAVFQSGLCVSLPSPCLPLPIIRCWM